MISSSPALSWIANGPTPMKSASASALAALIAERSVGHVHASVVTNVHAGGVAASSGPVTLKTSARAGAAVSNTAIVPAAVSARHMSCC